MRRLLIANRGEIARRILRTAKRRALTVAVVSTAADAGALVRREADAVLEVDSFLDLEGIVAAAAGWGADLVHPGYGFLSEQARFAEAVEARGMRFVGPTAENMRALGGKETARALAAELGVPTLPAFASTELSRLDPTEWPAALRARGIEAPYLVKAAAGGGGKGMRVVASANELPAAAARASQEARAAFGDGTVFIECFLESPRHVEAQVFGDGRGGGVFLGERECSLQRRHQKVVEEAPSPAVTPALREELGRAALALVRAARYRSAGTVEFLLEPSGRFHFLEVNTRLQVEHPVTEAVYGLDLVDAQLDLAEGRWPDALPSPEGFAVPVPRGWALEARILAEDPRRSFLPAPGLLRRFHEPSGPGVRVDSGVAAGCEVSVDFDPLLAKLVVHAPDRTAALERLTRALEDFVIHGCSTNLSFLHALTLHPDVRSGRFHTRWIDEHVAELNEPRLPKPVRELLGSPRVALAVAHALDGRAGLPVPEPVRRLASQPQAFPSFPAGVRERLEVEPGGQDGRLLLGGPALRAALAEVSAAARLPLTVTRLSPWQLAASACGETWTLADPREGGFREGRADEAESQLSAPMAGRVLEVRTAPGEAVREGQVLFVIESMKMQLEVASPASGIVKEVRVRPDEVLRGPDTLAVVGPRRATEE